MKVLACDPGLSGAFFLLRPSNDHEVWDMPTVEVVVNGKKRRRIYDHAVRDLIVNIGPVDMVVIEDLSTRPGESPAAAATMGLGHGIIRGILCAYERPYTVVRSQAWTKALGVGSDKGVHRLEAMRLFPGVADQFARVKDDGRADAALLAWWYWRHG
jgi:crossover junction endodeoxyribonuclease RuvC